MTLRVPTPRWTSQVARNIVHPLAEWAFLTPCGWALLLVLTGCLVWKWEQSATYQTCLATLWAVVLALCGLGYAVFQIKKGREVDALDDMDSILAEAASCLKKAHTSVLFMAGSPAIGLSGAPTLYDLAFRPELLNAANRLKGSKGTLTILCYEPSAMKQYYATYGISDTNLQRSLVPEIESLIYRLGELGVTPVYAKTGALPLPHLLLVDVDSHNERARCAVLWYLEPEPGGTEMRGAGFATRNRAIIDVLLKFFNDQVTKTRADASPAGVEGGKGAC